MITKQKKQKQTYGLVVKTGKNKKVIKKILTHAGYARKRTFWFRAIHRCEGFGINPCTTGFGTPDSYPVYLENTRNLSPKHQGIELLGNQIKLKLAMVWI